MNGWLDGRTLPDSQNVVMYPFIEVMNQTQIIYVKLLGYNSTYSQGLRF